MVAARPVDAMLGRVRQLCFLLGIASVTVFITGIFAYYVGIVAGLFAAIVATLTFARCESSELLAYGVTPCFGGLCGCNPRGELDGAMFMYLITMLVTVASLLTSILTAAGSDDEDWKVAFRIANAVFSTVQLLLLLTTATAFRQAVALAMNDQGEADPYNDGNATYGGSPVQHPPQMYAASPRTVFNSPPPTAAAPYGYASPQPVYPQPMRQPPQQPATRYAHSRSPVYAGARPLSTYAPDEQRRARARSTSVLSPHDQRGRAHDPYA